MAALRKIFVLLATKKFCCLPYFSYFVELCFQPLKHFEHSYSTLVKSTNKDLLYQNNVKNGIHN